MSPKAKRWWIAVAVLVVGVALMLIFPLPKSNTKGVHPSIANVPKPFRSVLTEYYLDGGSIGVQIVDAQGRTNKFDLPVSDGPDRYPEFVAGHIWQRMVTTEPRIALNLETKAYFCYVIEQSTLTGSEDTALIFLRGAPRDYLPYLPALPRILKEWVR